MKKRGWLVLGVAFASILQFLADGLWHESMLADMYGPLRPALNPSPHLLFILLGEFAAVAVIGFFYLHVPEAKRSVRTGATVGSILGLFMGLSQYSDMLGSMLLPFSIAALEVAKSLLLGCLSGIVIAACELSLNPNRKAPGR